MTAITTFDNPAFGTLKIFKDFEGREYYRAIDVCSILRLANPSQAIARYVKPKYVFQFDDGTNKAGLTNYVSEPGLYQLIFKSKTELAEQFQDWVFEEVLPKLRSQGYYIDLQDGVTVAKLEAELVKIKSTFTYQEVVRYRKENQLVEEENSNLLALGNRYMKRSKHYRRIICSLCNWDENEYLPLLSNEIE